LANCWSFLFPKDYEGQDYYRNPELGVDVKPFAVLQTAGLFCFQKELRSELRFFLETKNPCCNSKDLSGWQDSNLRPPAPKAGAITGLRYTPKRVQI
jgi:hypothetical protein